MPMDKPVFVSVLEGPREFYLMVGCEPDADDLTISLTEEDRIDDSLMFLEPQEWRSYTTDTGDVLEDDKVCFQLDRVWLKSKYGGVTTYLTLRESDDGEYSLSMMKEKDVEGTTSLWAFLHGNDSLGSGLPNVKMALESFPPPRQ